MARLPALPVKSSPGPGRPPGPLVKSRATKIRRLIERGWTTADIARKLAPKNPRRQKSIRTQIRAIIANDAELQAMAAMASQGIMLENLEGVTEAVAKRALRGRVDAAKLIYEASGFHNPKVKHEHTGDIKITVDIPRPKPVDAEVEEVTDADVVD